MRIVLRRFDNAYSELVKQYNDVKFTYKRYRWNKYQLYAAKSNCFINRLKRRK